MKVKTPDISTARSGFAATVDGLVGRDLDAAVADQVMGYELKGTAACDRDPDCNGLEIMPLSDPPSARGETHPVYMRQCRCDDYPITHVTYPEGPMKRIEIEANTRNTAEHNADLARWGHSRACLEIVPHYSSDIASAMDVVHKLRVSDGLDIEMESTSDNWEVILWNWERPVGKAICESLPEAICRAALEAVSSKPDTESAKLLLRDDTEEGQAS